MFWPDWFNFSHRVIHTSFFDWQSYRICLGTLDTVELVHVLAGVIIVQNDVLDEGIFVEMNLVMTEYTYFLRVHKLLANVSCCCLLLLFNSITWTSR